HPRHAFCAAGDEGVAGIHHQHSRSHLDRLNGGAAPAVDGCAGRRFRQAGQHADHAADVQALLAFGKGTAPDDVLDFIAGHAGAGNQFPDDMRPQILGTHAGQRPLARESEGRANVSGDIGFSCHGVSNQSLRLCRGYPAAVSASALCSPATSRGLKPSIKVSTQDRAISSADMEPLGSYHRAIQLSAPVATNVTIFASPGAMDPSAMPSSTTLRIVSSISRLRARNLARLSSESSWSAVRVTHMPKSSVMILA